MSLKNIFPSNPLFVAVKIADISYITVIYFVMGYLFGSYLDNLFIYLFGTDYSKKSKTTLILETLLQIVCIGIISYLGRNLILLIPSPFNGLAGLDHFRVKELTAPTYFSIFLILFQYSMQNKLIYIKDMP